MWGAILGSVVSGVLGNSSRKKAARQQRASQEEAENRNDARADEARGYALEDSARMRSNSLEDSARMRKNSLDDAAYNRGNQVRDRENLFSDLRSSAVSGGFNPLTALQLTGGAGFGSQAQQAIFSGSGFAGAAAPLPVTLRQGKNFVANDYSFVGDALVGVADIAAGGPAKRAAQEELDNDLKSAQIDSLRGTLSLAKSARASNTRISSPPVSTGPAFGAYDLGAAVSRSYKVEPLQNLPALADIELPSGRVISGINPDLELEGIGAWPNSMWVAGNTYADLARPFTPGAEFMPQGRDAPSFSFPKISLPKDSVTYQNFADRFLALPSSQ